MRALEVSAYDFMDSIVKRAHQEVVELTSSSSVSDLLHLLEEKRHERFEGAFEGGLQCLDHRECAVASVSHQR